MRVRVHDSLGSADRRTKYTAKNTSPADNSNENRNSQPECTPLRQSRAVDKVEGQCMSCEPPEYSSGRATLASEAHTPRLDNAPSLFILYSPQHHFCTSMCDSVSGERQAVSGRRRRESPVWLRHSSSHFQHRVPAGLTMSVNAATLAPPPCARFLRDVAVYLF